MVVETISGLTFRDPGIKLRYKVFWENGREVSQICLGALFSEFSEILPGALGAATKLLYIIDIVKMKT